MTDKTDEDRLDQLKAQQRAQSRREAALSRLAGQKNQSVDGKVAVVRTLHLADSERFASAISILMKQDHENKA